jgi:DivIVA domain-containing protein
MPVGDTGTENPPRGVAPKSPTCHDRHMGQFLLVLVVAIVAAAIVFGVVTLIGDDSAGLTPAEPDGRAVPLPTSRPLAEGDIAGVRFDTTVRGYRMEQVDQALRRAAYDIGYKDELISVLESEVEALRDGRQQDADELRDARRKAGPVPPGFDEPAGPVVVDLDGADSDALAASDEVAAADEVAARDEDDSDAGADGTGLATAGRVGPDERR